MKKSDFKNLKKIGELNLTEHIIGGEHYPKVETFINESTNEGYQVSFKHNRYRKTEKPNDLNDVMEYGDWLALGAE